MFAEKNVSREVKFHKQDWFNFAKLAKITFFGPALNFLLNIPSHDNLNLLKTIW